MILVVAGLIVLVSWMTRDPDTQPLDPNPSSSFKIVALGDSFVAGEGAAPYLSDTDDPSGNTCHRSRRAYPYLLAERMEASLTFVACSGARTEDVTGVDANGRRVGGQHPNSPDGVFGGRPQIEELEAVEDPSVVLIGIGGNDAGFVEIGVACAAPLLPDCRGHAKRWLRRLEVDVQPALVRTFDVVRRAARGAPVLALTYPNVLGPRFCDELAGLDSDEMTFLRDIFLPKLDATVEAAAEESGVGVIDLTEAFRGRRFCELPRRNAAINFIAFSRTRGVPIDFGHIGVLAHGSLHPNALGYRLIEPMVKEHLESLGAVDVG